MTPEEFDAEFTLRKTWRSRFFVWRLGMCQTCRGQQYSTITNTPCPTCGGNGTKESK